MSCSCRVLECAICTTSYTRSMVIKTATPEELLQNEHVRKIFETLRYAVANGNLIENFQDWRWQDNCQKVIEEFEAKNV